MDHFKVNTIGAIHLFNLFLPLILKGNAKKVIAISSCMGDLDYAREIELYQSGPYSLSKTALNMAMVKFSAQYREQGVLFMNICPGVVATDVLRLSKHKITSKAKYHNSCLIFTLLQIPKMKPENSTSLPINLRAMHHIGPDPKPPRLPLLLFYQLFTNLAWKVEMLLVLSRIPEQSGDFSRQYGIGLFLRMWSKPVAKDSQH